MNDIDEIAYGIDETDLKTVTSWVETIHFGKKYLSGPLFGPNPRV